VFTDCFSTINTFEAINHPLYSLFLARSCLIWSYWTCNDVRIVNDSSKLFLLSQNELRLIQKSIRISTWYYIDLKLKRQVQNWQNQSWSLEIWLRTSRITSLIASNQWNFKWLTLYHLKNFILWREKQESDNATLS
jgi:hypothetical protein